MIRARARYRESTQITRERRGKWYFVGGDPNLGLEKEINFFIEVTFFHFFFLLQSLVFSHLSC